VILVDTSIWIEHLRMGVPELVAALDQGLVWTHPFVLGELACGTLRKRKEVMGLMSRLPAVPRATDDEVLSLIESRRLMGRGIGYVDAHLLASALLEPPVRIWTYDRRLRIAATRLQVASTGY
jgi:predicted nucleic acid-binding protein